MPLLLQLCSTIVRACSWLFPCAAACSGGSGSMLGWSLWPRDAEASQVPSLPVLGLSRDPGTRLSHLAPGPALAGFRGSPSPRLVCHLGACCAQSEPRHWKGVVCPLSCSHTAWHCLSSVLCQWPPAPRRKLGNSVGRTEGESTVGKTDRCSASLAF